MLASSRPVGRPFWVLSAGLGFTLGLAAGGRLSPDEEKRPTFARAIRASRELLQRVKDEAGAPGIVVGVSVDGKEAWSEGLGFADVENRVPCKPEAALRIASISKSLTMTAIAKLCEEGKLDLDVPVQQYVPEFPEKEFEGEKVTISTRLLVSHLSGIRHYEKDVEKVREKVAKKGLKSEKDVNYLKALEESTSREKKGSPSNPEQPLESDNKRQSSPDSNKSKDFEAEEDYLKEYYLKDKFESVTDSLKLFKDDPLVFKPGSQFLYSTHAWSLLSAVVERASGKSFLEYMQQMFRDLGMSATVQEEHEPLIYNRARYYVFNKKGRLVNAPYVDNSYKWAGGGFLSTVGDLLTFGNVLLYSYQVQRFQKTGTEHLRGYLKPETVSMLWTQVPNTEMAWDKDGKYAMGWGAVEEKQEYGQCRLQRHYISHTGGAIGASSALLILPARPSCEHVDVSDCHPPRGVVVVLITNMQSVGVNSTALKIAREFEEDKSMSCHHCNKSIPKD